MYTSCQEVIAVNRVVVLCPHKPGPPKYEGSHNTVRALRTACDLFHRGQRQWPDVFKIDFLGQLYWQGEAEEKLEELLNIGAKELGVGLESPSIMLVAYGFEALRHVLYWESLFLEDRMKVWKWWKDVGSAALGVVLQGDEQPVNLVPLQIRFAYVVDSYPIGEWPVWFKERGMREKRALRFKNVPHISSDGSEQTY